MPKEALGELLSLIHIFYAFLRFGKHVGEKIVVFCVGLVVHQTAGYIVFGYYTCLLYTSSEFTDSEAIRKNVSETERHILGETSQWEGNTDSAVIPYWLVWKGAESVSYTHLVEFIKTNHSIQDAAALAIYSPAGIVVHTGDFKVDYTPVFGDAIKVYSFIRNTER